jgi:hypothetical protein
LESLGLAQSNARTQLKKVTAFLLLAQCTQFNLISSCPHAKCIPSHALAHLFNLLKKPTHFQTRKQFLSFPSIDDMASCVLALEYAIALAMVQQSM